MKTTICTSMRIQAGTTQSVAELTELLRAAEFALNRLEQLGRCTHSIDALRKAVADETAGYYTQRTEVLARGFNERQRLTGLKFADESGAE